MTEAQESNEDFKTATLEVSLPSTEFSNFINAMEFSEIGNLNSKNIQNIGAGGTAKISIVLHSPQLSTAISPGFGGKTLAAISSGGEAIGAVLLFLLPFWPLFIMVAAGIYLYKRKFQK